MIIQRVTIQHLTVRQPYISVQTKFLADYKAYPRNLINDLVPHVKETNTVRMWGGLTWIKDNPVTEIDKEAIENVEMNLWSADWADGIEMYNMGYDVTEAEKLIPEAIRMREEEDRIGLSRLTAKVFHILNNAEKIDDHPYHSYTAMIPLKSTEMQLRFEKYTLPDTKAKEFYDRTYAGWTAQIVGAAVGTALEGYNTEKLLEFFGEINDYVRKPSTYNDDITYELAFLDAFFEKGYQVSSEDIAAEWVARIPSGWSAEDIALKNVMLGIFPPESGCRSNPFREWIGAQMRGAVCGMAAPGNPEMAASLAFRDGVVSHHNNGVIGEIFML